MTSAYFNHSGLRKNIVVFQDIQAMYIFPHEFQGNPLGKEIMLVFPFASPKSIVIIDSWQICYWKKKHWFISDLALIHHLFITHSSLIHSYFCIDSSLVYHRLIINSLIAYISPPRLNELPQVRLQPSLSQILGVWWYLNRGGSGLGNSSKANFPTTWSEQREATGWQLSTTTTKKGNKKTGMCIQPMVVLTYFKLWLVMVLFIQVVF